MLFVFSTWFFTMANISQLYIKYIEYLVFRLKMSGIAERTIFFFFLWCEWSWVSCIHIKFYIIARLKIIHSRKENYGKTLHGF